MMIDHEKVGRQIVLLRKEKGLTGEKLAEMIGVSPQAVSKWENGRCLPETAILPLLAKALDCSIDTILIPQKLQILSAIYTDGMTELDVTQILNSLIRNNQLSIVVNQQFIGHTIETERLKVLAIKYQTPEGTYFSFTAEQDTLIIDIASKGFTYPEKFHMIGAFYGNQDGVKDVRNRIKYFDQLNWMELQANHELFPSDTMTDGLEFLTLIYLNTKGIYVISCAEEESLCYTVDRSNMYRKTADGNHCILPGIIPLQWNKQMDCTWAGALYASLYYMGYDITYEKLMGISGACYRVSFTEQWDWSSADALVSYDYASVGMKALGYELIWANRLDKDERKTERERIVADINQGKPSIGINLRVAPEWGVITGYLENGKRLLCRTYFDDAVWEEHRNEVNFAAETGGYLEIDRWPFLMIHFGEKKERLREKEALLQSLQVKVDSMHGEDCRGYHQGFTAYQRWIDCLLDEDRWNGQISGDIIERQLAVNDYQILNLIDARRCAADYLKNSATLLDGIQGEQLSQVAELYEALTLLLTGFRDKVQAGNHTELEYNMMKVKVVDSTKLRKEQAEVLQEALEIEYGIDALVDQVIKVIGC